ncbi:uncharacterized protein K452DRAFT_140008 [Aplosporella prunicola CBS 121167]|uniref:Heterokaryon incompatibility domain-containing protein n=1 Tax=Aplosporella prunicola CBS 121167 TaxID=1176127 RepID=A0A6A6AZI6_9PEZI|nr:uncharacterized protein K452DRAFT_140008 [Aplosporella prunicola CBS 121167]KAF2136187.1 hypothetical protein K452DRAFT_140008 [Aplosporella prunicola CBS 121167]
MATTQGHKRSRSSASPDACPDATPSHKRPHTEANEIGIDASPDATSGQSPEAEPIEFSSEPTNLCSYCKVLEFDDALHGSQRELEDGTKVFNPKDIVELDYGDEDYGITLIYKRNDTFSELPLLAEGAAAGCWFCAFLRLMMLKIYGGTRYGRSEYNIDFHELGIYIRGSFLGVWFTIGSEKWDSFFLNICANSGACATWLQIEHRPMFRNSLSEARISKIQSWLSRCESTCHPSLKDFPLPTRLIDVGTNFNNEAKLIETRGHTEMLGSRYVTLSYCWGDPESQLKTTRAKLKNHKERIPLEELSQTCHDAIMLTRCLGIKYLWVDALCIVQGDEKDWEAESSSMFDIYRNAHLTIVDLNAGTSHAGLLKPTGRPSVCVKLNLPRGSTKTYKGISGLPRSPGRPMMFDMRKGCHCGRLVDGRFKNRKLPDGVFISERRWPTLKAPIL